MRSNISRDDLAQRLAAGTNVVLIEALGAPFYADAHLPSSINIPPRDVAVLAPRLLGDRSATIIVYGSASTDNAAIVADRLEALGYRDVRLYAAGKEDWVEHGLPVERSDDVD